MKTYFSESIYRRAIEEIDLELNEYKHLLNSINQGVSRFEIALFY